MLCPKDLYDKVYTPEDFLFFWGHTARNHKLGKQCLSQWFEAPMVVDDIYYFCMEQFIMAQKALTFGDNDSYNLIMLSHNQMEVKKLGRRVAAYVDEVWSAVRAQIAVKGNLAKFSQNLALGQFLRHTRSKILVEASPKDKIWGIGLDEHSPLASQPQHWQGQNLLGFVLMEVRDILFPE